MLRSEQLTIFGIRKGFYSVVILARAVGGLPAFVAGAMALLFDLFSVF